MTPGLSKNIRYYMILFQLANHQFGHLAKQIVGRQSMPAIGHKQFNDREVFVQAYMGSQPHHNLQRLCDNVM